MYPTIPRNLSLTTVQSTQSSSWVDNKFSKTMTNIFHIPHVHIYLIAPDFTSSFVVRKTVTLQCLDIKNKRMFLEHSLILQISFLLVREELALRAFFPHHSWVTIVQRSTSFWLAWVEKPQHNNKALSCNIVFLETVLFKKLYLTTNLLLCNNVFSQSG